MNEEWAELMNLLRETIAKKDNQIDALVEERDRLRSVVRSLQEDRTELQSKVIELLDEIVALREKLE